MGVSKKGLYITGAAALVLVLGIGGYFLFAGGKKNEDKPKADDITAQANALPDSMKQAIQRDLNLSPVQFTTRVSASSELASFSIDAKSEVKANLAGVYLDSSGTPTINVTSQDLKEKLEKSRKEIATVPVKARDAIRKAKDAVAIANKNTVATQLKPLVGELKAARTANKEKAQQTIDQLNQKIKDAISQSTDSKLLQTLKEAQTQLSPINAINIASELSQKAISTVEQLINKAVGLAQSVVTQALNIASSSLSAAVSVNIGSSDVTSAIGKAQDSVKNAIKVSVSDKGISVEANADASSLVKLATDSISSVANLVSAIIDIPANTVINVVKNTTAQLNEAATSTQQWISSFPTDVSNQVVGVATDVVNNGVNLIVKQSTDKINQISLPDSLGNVSIVEVRPDIQTGKQTFGPISIETSADGKVSVAGGVAIPQPSNNTLPGGTGFGIPSADKSQAFYCSAGFNAKDSEGKPAVLVSASCAAGTQQAQANLKLSPTTFVVDGSLPNLISNVPALQLLNTAAQTASDIILAKPLGKLADKADATVRTGTNQTVAVTGTTDPVPGMPVCKFGQTTGFTCGNIVLDGLSLPVAISDTVAKAWSPKTFLADVCARGGDNGAPFISGTLAVGMLSGGPAVNMTGSVNVPCTGNSLLDKLIGNWSVVTPVSDALKAFPGTTINTTSNT